MRRISAGLAMLAVLASSAFSQYVPLEVDFAEIPLSAEIKTSVGNTPTLRVYYRQNGTNFNPSGWTPFFKWGLNESAVDGMVVVPGTNGASYSDFFCLSNTFGRVVDNGYWAVMLTRSNGSQNITAARGRLTVKRSPEISNSMALQRTTPVNWDLISNTGTLPWISYAVGANTDILARINIGVLSNWVAEVSNTLAAQSLAIGAGASNLWNSGTGSLWSAINAKATGTPLYVESDPSWTAASNATAAGILTAQATGVAAMAAAQLALTNLQESGSGNAITGSAVVGRSGVLYRGTIASGSGSETQGLASVLAINSTAETFTVAMSNSVFLSAPYNVMVDYNAAGEGYRGNVMIGGGGANSESGQSYNSMSGTTHSVVIGGAGIRMIDSMPTSDIEHVQFSAAIASHGSDIISTPALEGGTDGVKYNGILACNNMHLYDGQFVGMLSSGGTLVTNASLGVLLASSHGKIQNPQTNNITAFFHWGTSAWISNSYAVAFGGRGYSDTNYYRDHGDNSFNIGMGSLWMQHSMIVSGNTHHGDGSGLTNLPSSGGFATYYSGVSVVSNTHVLANGTMNQLTASNVAQVVKWGHTNYMPSGLSYKPPSAGIYCVKLRFSDASSVDNPISITMFLNGSAWWPPNPALSFLGNSSYADSKNGLTFIEARFWETNSAPTNVWSVAASGDGVSPTASRLVIEFMRVSEIEAGMVLP
jgi:hypothetical protein